MPSDAAAGYKALHGEHTERCAAGQPECSAGRLCDPVEPVSAPPAAQPAAPRSQTSHTAGRGTREHSEVNTVESIKAIQVDNCFSNSS